MNGVTRRVVVATAAVSLSGCSRGEGPGESGNGDDGDTGDGADQGNPALASAEREGALVVGSPAFDNGDDIPRKYGRGEEDVNPPLEISDVLDGTESLVIVVDDPDAVDVVGEVFVHWLVWNVPPETTTIPEDWSPETAVQGENDFGDIGYGGPAPPDEPHTYRFKIFALDVTLDLETGATIEALGDAMAGHIVGRAQLVGSYAP